MSAPAASQTSRDAYKKLASEAGLDFVTLDPTAADQDGFKIVNPLAARLLSEKVCRHFGMLSVSYLDGMVTVASSDPHDALAREVAQSITGRQVRFVVATPQDIARSIDDVFAELPASFAGTGFPGAAPTVDEPPTAPPEPAPAPTRPAALPTLLPGRIADLPVARGLATEAQIPDALVEQRRTGSKLGEVLVSTGVLDEHQLVSALAEQFQLPLVDLTDYEPDPAALELIPEPLARHLRCVPIGVEAGTPPLGVARR